MGKKYQIFVSSTYDDLEHERQIAIDTIIKLGADTLQEWNCFRDRRKSI